MSATIFLMIIANTIFLTLTHPLAMGLTLIFQTALAAVAAGFLANTFWFSYLLILIFLGGMLILFVYISTLAPNESMNSPSPQMFLTLLMGGVFLFLTFSIPSHLTAYDSMNFISPFVWMSSEALLAIFSFIIAFLFFVLIAVVKITKFWTGPLRPVN